MFFHVFSRKKIDSSRWLSEVFTRTCFCWAEWVAWIGPFRLRRKPPSKLLLGLLRASHVAAAPEYMGPQSGKPNTPSWMLFPCSVGSTSSFKRFMFQSSHVSVQ